VKRGPDIEKDMQEKENRISEKWTNNSSTTLGRRNTIWRAVLVA
jgi:hypothetical protein